MYEKLTTCLVCSGGSQFVLVYSNDVLLFFFINIAYVIVKTQSKINIDTQEFDNLITCNVNRSESESWRLFMRSFSYSIGLKLIRISLHAVKTKAVNKNFTFAL